MKPTEFKFSLSVESYDEKTAENYQNFYVAEKHICMYFPDYQRYRSQILIAHIEDLDQDCVKISRPHL